MVPCRVLSRKNMMLSQVIAVIGLFLVPVDFVRGNVIELDDRFLDIKSQGKWLVEFYAPWCGHCQKLKPVWADVGLQLMKTHPRLHVARLDGTRFSRVMDAYDVRGFPSIKYIEGDKVFTHNGGRTSQDIIDFALKAQGPAVKQLTSASSLEQFRAKKDVFFAFIAEDMSSDFAKTFSEVADKRILDAFYYHIQPAVLPDKMRPKETPALLVFKDDRYYPYPVPAEGVSESDLSKWIGNEMYPAFLRIGNENINPIGRTEKLIAIGLVYPSASTYKSHPHSIMLERIRDVAIDTRDTFQKRVQFGYMEDSNLLSDIILRSAEVPGIFVIDPVTYLYYELENPLEQTEESLVSFINSVIDGTAEAKGGNSFLRKIYRVFYEIIKSIVMMWLGQPILMTLLIALPTVLISFICYSICTAEPIDEDADIRDSEEEEEDDPNDADKEGTMIEEVGETNPSGHQKTE